MNMGRKFMYVFLLIAVSALLTMFLLAGRQFLKSVLRSTAVRPAIASSELKQTPTVPAAVKAGQGTYVEQMKPDGQMRAASSLKTPETFPVSLKTTSPGTLVSAGAAGLSAPANTVPQVKIQNATATDLGILGLAGVAGTAAAVSALRGTGEADQSGHIAASVSTP